MFDASSQVTIIKSLAYTQIKEKAAKYTIKKHPSQRQQQKKRGIREVHNRQKTVNKMAAKSYTFQ